MIRVTPFRALITLLITYLLSPLPLHVPMQQLPRTETPNLEHLLLGIAHGSKAVWSQSFAVVASRVKPRAIFAKLLLSLGEPVCTSYSAVNAIVWVWL